MQIRPVLLTAALALLSACSRGATDGADARPARAPEGFPAPDRPVAPVGADGWSSGPDRDAADESGQLIRGLGIGPGMAVADIGAGSGYHTLRLSPAVGETGVVYAEDINAAYVAGLKREAERRGLANVRIVVGTPADPKLPAPVDRAILVHMYHEIENPYALLWNLAPMLKPGGRVGVVDVDRPTKAHGVPPGLLECEFAAVGYRMVDFQRLQGGVGYLAVFEPPAEGRRPRPADIQACDAPD
jgi:tRNA(1-methyladenosine) methyltransferase and related methyltransferases